MSRMLETVLVALSLLAGVSLGHAADNSDTGGRDGLAASRNDAPDLQEREKLIDPDATGSVQTCESRSYDEFGNCIVEPDMP